MRRSLIRAALTFAAAGALVPTMAGAVDYGQVVFQNNTSVTGHLYVDDGYGCGPVLMNLYCATMVPAGVHTSYVKFDDGEVVTFEAYEVVAGEVFTLTVNEAAE